MQAGEMTQAQMQAQFEQYHRQLAEAQQADMAHHHEEASTTIVSMPGAGTKQSNSHFQNTQLLETSCMSFESCPIF